MGLRLLSSGIKGVCHHSWIPCPFKTNQAGLKFIYNPAHPPKCWDEIGLYHHTWLIFLMYKLQIQICNLYLRPKFTLLSQVFNNLKLDTARIRGPLSEAVWKRAFST